MPITRSDLLELIRLRQLCEASRQHVEIANDRMISAIEEHRNNVRDLEKFLDAHIEKLNLHTRD